MGRRYTYEDTEWFRDVIKMVSPNARDEVVRRMRAHIDACFASVRHVPRPDPGVPWEAERGSDACGGAAPEARRLMPRH